jgi:orotidine-5'-phosphate decarboxylase
MLHSKTMTPVRERLICALDVPDAAAAKTLVEQMGDAVSFYKIGLELSMSGDYLTLLDWLVARGKRVFADLKFYDIPNTVGSAVRQLAPRKPMFLTIHGDDGIMKAAAAEKGEMKILAVTVLTSLSDADLKSMGIEMSARDLVLARAQRAQVLGCDGVVASGHEAEALRKLLGPEFLIVVPGIRPASARGADDQQRTVDVEEAFELGASHIVMGRPLRAAADPRQAAEDVQARIAKVFA